MSAPRVARLAAPMFVVLWASGFIVARLVRPYAEPFTFITVRFALSAVALGVLAVALGALWPRTARGWVEGIIAGALMQGVYVAGVFWAVKHGLPPALAALISGLQPLATGLLAMPLLGERVSPMRWTGIATGFTGAVLVIAPNLHGSGSLSPMVVASCGAGMLGITLGTIWQKRIGGDRDLRSGAAVQFIGGLLVTTPLMLTAEHRDLGHHVDVWIGLAWGVVVLSVITTLLLLWLIRRGDVAAVVSLFYLVPPVTALIAFVLFGDALAPIQFFGMAVAAVGVFIANRG